jgi:hypothetical protein
MGGVWTDRKTGIAAPVPTVNYQFYLLESIRQARMWNPGVPFFLLTDDWAMIDTYRPAWGRLLAMPFLNVTVVDVRPLRDWELQEIELRFRDIWGPLGYMLGATMKPSMAGGTNFAFTIATLLRLVYLHHWVRATGQQHVFHVENDQMIYGSIHELLGAAQSCGVDFAVGRVTVGRYAASVMYTNGAAPLNALLKFTWSIISHGAHKAVEMLNGNM